jgi:Protein of unknown function (DUF2971)
VTDNDLLALFAPLYMGFANLADTKDRPTLLAHYTSISVLQKIMETNEIWFSNPMLMNDLQEMRFGMVEGLKIFNEYAREQQFIRAFVTPQKAATVLNVFNNKFLEFDLKHALNIYVFCLSRHEPADNDGLLSMWRGYGSQGHGAALVFKTDFWALKDGSPLFFGKVQYATTEQRIAWIKELFNQCIEIVARSEIPDDKMYHVAHHMFETMKLYALLSKHRGFLEEQEWRIIYMPDRDIHKLMESNFTYLIGKNGIEPKLKLPIEPLKIEPIDTWTFHSILDRIILGPRAFCIWVYAYPAFLT